MSFWFRIRNKDGTVQHATAPFAPFLFFIFVGLATGIALPVLNNVRTYVRTGAPDQLADGLKWTVAEAREEISHFDIEEEPSDHYEFADTLECGELQKQSIYDTIENPRPQLSVGDRVVTTGILAAKETEPGKYRRTQVTLSMKDEITQ